MKAFYRYLFVVLSTAVLFSCETDTIIPANGLGDCHADLPTISIQNLPTPNPLVGGIVSNLANTPVDDNCIPLTKLGDKLVYYPINIAQIANTYYKNYVETGDEQSLAYFMNLATWLRNNLVYKQNAAVWPCYAYYPAYKLEEGWVSCMAQGFGISAMMIANKLSGDQAFLDIAEDAVQAFDMPLEEGGVVSDWDGVPFYEEYPSDDPPHVLNGFVFGLSGLYHLWVETGNSTAKKYFDIGAGSLQQKLADYDFGFTSYYSFIAPDGQLANAIGKKDGYHQLHIQQLLWMFHTTQDSSFYHYAHRFLQYDIGEFELIIDEKLSSVSASNCIDCSEYGPSHLNDGFWSYGKYWSSDRFPVELTVNLESVKKQVEAVVIYSTGDAAQISNFNIYYKDENGAKKLAANLTPNDVMMQYSYETGSYLSDVRKFRIEPPIISTDRLFIEILKPEEEIVELREIDFHYDRYHELELIYKSLNYE